MAIWETAGGRLAITLEKGDSMCFSPGGGKVAVVSYGGTWSRPNQTRNDLGLGKPPSGMHDHERR